MSATPLVAQTVGGTILGVIEVSREAAIGKGTSLGEES